MPSRTIAIGDIHGCSRALGSLLEAIQPRTDDVIVPLGDYVNRGPDSRGVIDRLIALEAQCTVLPLLGNHDQMLLDARAGRPRAFSIWMRMGGGPTLLSYGASAATATRNDLARLPAEHSSFLERCRPYHETEAYIFVHAKYKADSPMDRQPDWLLRWEPLRDGIPGPHVTGKTVIAGHTSQKSAEILDLGHLVCIDTHCYGGGWLTALEVHTRQVWQADPQGKLRST
jgi:serine/threonine protein phosphatase 1